MKKFFTILALVLRLSLAPMALAEDSNTQTLPCDAQPGEVYVELNEALGSTKCIKGKGGISFIKNYISQIYIYGAGLVGVIAVFSIVVGGIQLMVGGDSQQDEVKTRLGKTFAGIAILFLSGLILYLINPTFFVAQ